MATSAIGRIHQLTESISRLSTQYTEEQLKLSTGYKTDYYSGLDIKRVESLSVRNRLNEVTGYQDTISLIDSRLAVTDTIMNRMSELRATTRSEMFESNYETIDGNQVIEQVTADTSLQEMIEHFNRRIGGRYIFGGAETNTAPTESYDTIMNGDVRSGKDGFNTVLQEFIDANIGPSTTQADSVMGRLILADNAGGLITLSEDGAGAHPYGLKILSVESSMTNLTVTHNNSTDGTIAGPFTLANDATAEFGADLVAGDFTLTDAAGNSETLTIGLGVSGNDVLDFINESGMGRASVDENGDIEIEYGAHVTASGSAVVGAGNFASGGAAAQQSDNVTFNFTDVPPVSDSASVTVRFTLGDDMEDGVYEVTLSAGSRDILDPLTGEPILTNNDEFPIGLTAADTATNFAKKLEERIEQIALTDLRAKASFDAADAFFDIDGNGLPQRLNTAGGTIAAADVETALIDGDGSVDSTNNTVLWYKGDPTLIAEARETIQIRLDSTVSVDVGMQANEVGFTSYLKTLSVLSASNLAPAVTSEGTDMKADLYHAIRVSVGQAIPVNGQGEQTLDQIWQDITTTRTIIEAAKERHEFTANFSKTVLSDIELANQEEAAANLLSLQTRLQASYQVTSMLQNMSLVNYL